MADLRLAGRAVDRQILPAKYIRIILGECGSA
jgi:hypothetical protein